MKREDVRPHQPKEFLGREMVPDVAVSHATRDTEHARRRREQIRLGNAERTAVAKGRARRQAVRSQVHVIRVVPDTVPDAVVEPDGLIDGIGRRLDGFPGERDHIGVVGVDEPGRLEILRGQRCVERGRAVTRRDRHGRSLTTRTSG